MTTLLLGILLFFATHSVRIVAEPWRVRQIARFGEGRWKVAYSVLSLLGLGLIAAGFADTTTAAPLWSPPSWTRHLAAAMTLPAFVLVVAAYLPGSRLRAALGHPMLAGIQLWALAHLLANGRPGDVLLFGCFTAWSVAAFVAARRRDRITGRAALRVRPGRDLAVLAAGLAAWALFARYGHPLLIGVPAVG